MLKVRLVRAGKKNLPSFRIEVTEGEKTVDLIGSYYPHSTKSKFSISKDRLDHWLKSGAKPTPAVADLIKGKYEFKPYYGSRPAEEEKAAPVEVSAPSAPATPVAPEPAPLETPAPQEEPVKPKEVSSEKSSPASENSEQPNA